MNDKIPGPGDELWLLSKAILLIIINFGIIFVACLTAVALGGVVMTATANTKYGFVTGIGIYLAVMGGREWVLVSLASRFFNSEDVERMSSYT